MKIKIGADPEINFHTPCDFRAEIYRGYLEEVYCSFRRKPASTRLLLVPAVTFTDGRHVKEALLDVQLLEALAQVLDRYVIIGVVEDLARWCKKVFEEASRPAPPFFRPTEPIDVNFLNDGTWDKDPEKIERAGERELKNAYRDYFQLYISRTDTNLMVIQGGEVWSGVEAFYRRYPLIKHAVEKCSVNFRSNILLACERIENDWEDIGDVFFPDNRPEKLAKIKTSGSDTHKGGKQVLFLTFQLGHEPRTQKLIYKPSDVEMDYRLVGNTDMIRANAHYQLGGLQSLAELVNSHLDKQPGLPTYRILPRSPGSILKERMSEDDHTPFLPIQDSYGYIEFLTHEPPAGLDGKPVKSWWRLTIPPGDWVTNEKKDVKDFYRLFGGYMVMSSVFSLCDVHHENIIVHNRRPYLIDQENSFAKPLHGFDGVIGDGLKKFDVLDRDASPYYSDKKVTLQRMTASSLRKPTKNRIWLSADGNPPERADPEKYTGELCDGIIDLMGVLGDHQAVFLEWLNGIRKCIARSVIFPTMTYYDRLNLAFSDPKVNLLDLKNGDLFKKWEDEAKSFYRYLRSGNSGVKPKNIEEIGKYNIWPNSPADSPMIIAAPIFAMQTWDNDFHDYLNCDIPAYYHRLDSKDLLNARGKKVNVRADSTFDAGRESYFPQPTWEIVKTQLEQLGTFEGYSKYFVIYANQIDIILTKPISAR